MKAKASVEESLFDDLVEKSNVAADIDINYEQEAITQNGLVSCCSFPNGFYISAEDLKLQSLAFDCVSESSAASGNESSHERKQKSFKR